jgi:DEAD/DEAH box helicase domain-containing protein
VKNIIYFDLETQKSFDEVGGRTERHLRDLRLSIGVTYSTRDQVYRIFHEGNVQDLVTQLMRADLIVGHNIISFDYTVLSAYTPFDFTQVPTLDTLVDLMKILNFRLKLDSLAKATIGNTKTAEGLEAIAWWRKGDPESILKIAEYCCYDVKLTRLIHEYGHQNGKVFYFDRMGQKRAVKVAWQLN